MARLPTRRDKPGSLPRSSCVLSSAYSFFRYLRFIGLGAKLRAVRSNKAELQDVPQQKLGPVHTIRSASMMKAKQRKARNTTSSFSKRENMRHLLIESESPCYGTVPAPAPGLAGRKNQTRNFKRNRSGAESRLPLLASIPLPPIKKSGSSG
jgi:hypothetical protein